jgi:hypothetical protein
MINEVVYREAVVAYFKVLSYHLSGDTEENLKNFTLDSRCTGRESKWEPPGKKLEALRPEPAFLLGHSL